jgi:hypothetical protein
MAEPSSERWYHGIVSKAADYIAKNFSPSYADSKTEINTQRVKISGLEQEVEILRDFNLDLIKAQKETERDQNHRIVETRREYKESVEKEGNKYVVLLDTHGVVRYQGKKAIELLGNLHSKNISTAFYAPEGSEPVQTVLNTLLDVKEGYLHIQNGEKNFPIDITVEQLKIKDPRFPKPIVHTTRVDISPEHGWKVLGRKILHNEKHPLQLHLIAEADKHDRK